MGELELIKSTYLNSELADELRDSEIDVLAKLSRVRDYKAGEVILQPGNGHLKNTLMMLASGEVEAAAVVNGENMTLHLLQPGDLAGIITFVGGQSEQISATIVAKSDSKVVLLERGSFESLLSGHPQIMYYVMRGVIRHMHGIVRRMNRQSQEMTNYMYQGHY